MLDYLNVVEKEIEELGEDANLIAEEDGKLVRVPASAITPSTSTQKVTIYSDDSDTVSDITLDLPTNALWGHIASRGIKIPYFYSDYKVIFEEASNDRENDIKITFYDSDGESIYERMLYTHSTDPSESGTVVDVASTNRIFSDEEMETFGWEYILYSGR